MPRSEIKTNDSRIIDAQNYNNKIKLLNSSLGFSFLETIVTMAIISIIALSMGQMLFSNSRTIANLEFLNEVREFDNEITFLLGNQSQCESAFINSGGSEATYTSGTSNVSQTIVAGNLFFRLNETPRGFHKFSIASISFIDSGISPTRGRFINSRGQEINGHNHIVALEVRVNSLVDQHKVKVIRKPLKLFTDNSDRIRTCNVRPNFERVRAMARRLMIGIVDHYCIERPAPQFYQANSCADSNSDGLCDHDRRLARIPHPMSTMTPNTIAKWNNSFPSRNPGYWGPAPVTTAQEGRCPVRIDFNETLEDPNNIFVLETSTVPYSSTVRSEGLGCNASNGWRIVGCTANGFRPIAGGDINQVQIRGNEVCITSRHTRPHLNRNSRNDWWAPDLDLTVICEKVIQN